MMHTLRLLLLSALFCLPLLLYAQTSTVRGTVRDQQSETPLVGATIQILNADNAPGGVGDMSDPDGFFALKNVPVGRQTLRVSYLGYEVQTIPNILVTAGKEVQLNIR
ncbi:MAG: carboxypeptidase-like regulatory domain-containing protein, partial [Saprospiraceae bacterium]|nr:carboxypeptidase-like regulatory domain-containing protein [Saprospiraceae bacterium]